MLKQKQKTTVPRKKIINYNLDTILFEKIQFATHNNKGKFSTIVFWMPNI